MEQMEREACLTAGFVYGWVCLHRGAKESNGSLVHHHFLPRNLLLWCIHYFWTDPVEVGIRFLNIPKTTKQLVSPL